MIKELEVLVNGHRSNYDYYKRLGYDINYRKPCNVRVSDLMPGSNIKITSVCDKCGIEIKNFFKDYYNYTQGLLNEYYCNRCNKLKAKETCLKKYGVENPMQSDDIKEKLKKSLLDKYGVNHYSKTDEYKKKFKETNLHKWGFEYPSQNEEVKNKIKQTNLDKFGVEYTQQSEEVRNKSDESNLKKYGFKKYSQTEECKSKIIQNQFDKWGTYYSNTEEYKQKIRQTNLDKYGVEHYSKTNQFKEIIKINRESLTKLRYENLIGDNYEIISYRNNLFNIFHKDCEKKSSINRDALYSRLNLDICLCTDCYPLDIHQSYIEIEIQDFLNGLNISYEVKNKKILNGLELDIYLADCNLAIEVNGIYWHSEIYKEENYHINKTTMCKEKGIQLLHIWEDDWKFKRNIIKSIILNKLGLLRNKIYARKCLIREVSPQEAKLFLDNNHIQGYSPSQIKLGLCFNDELISLMTFGWRFTSSKKEYELIRFCNKLNYNVIGAASKLFTYFIKNNNIEEIISYADISLFNGSVYEKLGFKRQHLSKPNYFWVVDNMRKHRFNFNKQKLIKEGFDPNKTEVEIMHERGYYRVFSCGQEKWIYIQSKNM
jgi:hypothetical protein